MKEFKVIIVMAVGTTEEPVYHEFFTKSNDAMTVFREIKKKDWFHYGSESYITDKGIKKKKVYNYFIQTNHIADISIMEEIKL